MPFDPFMVEEKCLFCAFTVFSIPLSMKGVYKGRVGGEVFFRSFCSQDGFLTLREGEAAPCKSGACMFSLILVHFNPFIVGKKSALVVPLPCSLYRGAK